MRRWCLLGCLWWGASVCASTGLVDVYRLALDADQTFQMATSEYLAAREAVPLAAAKLLPDLDAAASFTHVRTENKNPDSTVETETGVVKLTLSQPIIDLAEWRALGSAKATVRAARNRYEHAAQDLLLRVAERYFAVLEAHDVLRYSQAQTASLGRQRAQTQARFDVGLDAITELHEVNAQYDTAVAAELAAGNALSNALEDLRVMTGQYHRRVAALSGKRMPLVSPQPACVADWVRRACKRNHLLQAALADAEVAHDNVLVARAAHLPVLSATGGYTYTRDTDSTLSGEKSSQVPSAGLRVDLPVLKGGALSAASRQAAHKEAMAHAKALQVHREVANATRQAYLGVLSGIGQIKATRKAVFSAQTALEAMQEAYKVGTRDLTDVLTAQSTLYAAQKDDAKQQYAYLLAMLTLKEEAGLLTVGDLAQMDRWFKQTVRIPEAIGRGERVPAGLQLAKPKALLTQRRAAKPVGVSMPVLSVTKHLPLWLHLPIPGGFA